MQVPDIRYAIIYRDGSRCRYCSRELREGDPDFSPAIDHIYPRCQGGTDAPANLATACKYCNSKKGGRTPEQAGMLLLEAPNPINWSLATELETMVGLSQKQAIEAACVASGPLANLNGSLSMCRTREARMFLLAASRVGSCLCNIEERPFTNDTFEVRCDVDQDEEEQQGIFFMSEEVLIRPVPPGVFASSKCDFLLLADEARLGVRIDSMPMSFVDHRRALLSWNVVQFGLDEVTGSPVACLSKALEILSRLEDDLIQATKKSSVNSFKRGWAKRGVAIERIHEEGLTRLVPLNPEPVAAE